MTTTQSPTIPPEAFAAAKEAMREVTPPPGVSKSEWLAEHGTWALLAGAIAAAAPAIVAQALIDAADDPGLRLSGHSGISITRLRHRARQVSPAPQPEAPGAVLNII